MKHKSSGLLHYSETAYLVPKLNIYVSFIFSGTIKTFLSSLQIFPIEQEGSESISFSS